MIRSNGNIAGRPVRAHDGDVVRSPAVEDAQQELSDVQGRLVTSETERLEVSRALLDVQMELNAASVAAEQEKYSLSRRILDLEGRLAQGLISSVRPRTRALHVRAAQNSARCTQHRPSLPRRSRSVQAHAAALEAGKDEAEHDLAHTHKQLHFTHQHMEQLARRITELEAAKHAVEQQCQEETAQLRIRLVEDLHAQHVRHCPGARRAVDG